MKKFIYSFLFLLLTGCSNNQTHLKHVEAAFPVKVGKAIRHDVPVYVETIGNVAPYNRADIKAQVNGIVAERFVQAGDAVKMGDLLFLLDSLPFYVALEKAEATLHKDEAELEFAQKRLERYATLVKDEFISKITVEEYTSNVKALEAQVKIDKAAVEEARINLGYSVIDSPFEGRVGINLVDAGNTVRANDTPVLATILQTKPVYINFVLSQKDFQEYRKGVGEGNKLFKVLLPYGSEDGYEGEFEAVDNQFNVNTGTVQLQGTIANENEELWPGEFVKIRLYVRIKKQAITVPYSAIQFGQKGSFVYILQDDMTVKDVPVKIGERMNDLIVIEQGIDEGQKVITDGQLNLSPGVKVNIQGSLS